MTHCNTTAMGAAVVLGRLLALAIAVVGSSASAVAAQPPDMNDAAPRLVVPEAAVELGTVQAGDEVPMTWRIQNAGDADLVIERIKPGCGCTIVRLAERDQIIRAGEELELEATFNSTGRRGNQEKETILFTNDPENPEFTLSYHAFVDRLYEVVPSRFVDLRTVQRGTTAARTIDVVEDKSRGEVTVLHIDVPQGTPLEFKVEPFQETKAIGKRISVTVLSSAATGKLRTDATLHLQIGDNVREHLLTIRAEIVGEINWLPKVVDSTRRPLRPGNSLAPVTVLASSGSGFRVLRATAGNMFDVGIEPSSTSGPRKRHLVKLTLRENVPPGPFGVTLQIETDAPDLPVIKVPVYGIVMPRLQIDPPVVVLRLDGTPAGSSRTVRLKTYPGSSLTITGLESQLNGVVVQPNVDAQKSQRHIQFIEVHATESLTPGAHASTIVISTDVPGFDRVEIPVRVEPVE